VRDGCPRLHRPSIASVCEGHLVAQGTTGQDALEVRSAVGQLVEVWPGTGPEAHRVESMDQRIDLRIVPNIAT